MTISDLDAVTMYSLSVTAINDEGFRSEISDTQKYTTKELGKTIFATPTERIVNYLCSIVSTMSCNDSMRLQETQFNCATNHIIIKTMYSCANKPAAVNMRTSFVID